jgi:ethanolamine ammonia-lyase small subunit
MTMQSLKRFTIARVGLGRTGNSLSTHDLLDFQLAHARARDAVHKPLDTGALAAELQAAGMQSIALHSAARDRCEYLRRPDLGRTLDLPSRLAMEKTSGQFDVIFIVADGLSPFAVQSFPMPDEPEGARRFQRQMSLKERGPDAGD